MADRDRAGLTAVGGEASARGAGPAGPGPGRDAWSRADGRKFGLLVGGSFLALGGLFLWRGHEVPAWIVGAVGGVLGGLGLLVPGRLRPVYRAWMSLARGISRVTTPIVLSLVYFLVLTPTGLVRRIFGDDPLERAAGRESHWKSRAGEPRSDLRRQF